MLAKQKHAQLVSWAELADSLWDRHARSMLVQDSRLVLAELDPEADESVWIERMYQLERDPNPYKNRIPI